MSKFSLACQDPIFSTKGRFFLSLWLAGYLAPREPCKDDTHKNLPNATGHLAQDLRPEKRYKKLFLGGRLCFPWVVNPKPFALAPWT